MIKDRKERILEIISKEDIKKQEDLVIRLNNEGYNVTQATISRDIKKMGLVKASKSKNSKAKYTYKKNELDEKEIENYIKILNAAYVSLDIAGSLVVLKTVAGMAMAVAAAIDNLKVDGIVGSIAGDDTIFLAISEKYKANDIKERIEGFIFNK